MNLILFAAIITIAAAGQLPSRSYIPQGQGQGPGNQGSGGFGAHGGSGGFGNQGGSGFGGQGGSGGFGGQGGSGGFGGHGGSGSFGGSQGGFGGSSQGQHGGSAGGYHQGSQSGGYGGSGGFGGNGNGNRPQQSQEKNAAVLKQDQAIDESGSYHFGYETENGIRAEEAGNPADAQGGFSYKGDDGHTYTITYTAGEGGFRPQGEHLPIAPPTPQAILEALQKNAQDEAAGIFDDGFYKGEGANAGHSGGYNSNRPGQTRPSFGNSGNHQNGFNPNSGYTY